MFDSLLGRYMTPHRTNRFTCTVEWDEAAEGWLGRSAEQPQTVFPFLKTFSKTAPSREEALEETIWLFNHFFGDWELDPVVKKDGPRGPEATMVAAL